MSSGCCLGRVNEYHYPKHSTGQVISTKLFILFGWKMKGGTYRYQCYAGYAGCKSFGTNYCPV